MTLEEHGIHVFINQARYSFQQREQTGRAIKERACVPLDHVLCVEIDRREVDDKGSCEQPRGGNELKVVDDEAATRLEGGQHFWSHAKAKGEVTVTIDGKDYSFADRHQTGRSLKERAGIPLTDVLFLDRPDEDEVIADDAKVALKCGDCFHSAPPANYGNAYIDAASLGTSKLEVVRQADGWTFLFVNDYGLPGGYSSPVARLLVKLPPTFPDAAPDMFWLYPHIKTAAGTAPQGTSGEAVLGQEWQRFSWHLLPGAWRPGKSTLRDYMRCVRARLEKRN